MTVRPMIAVAAIGVASVIGSCGEVDSTSSSEETTETIAAGDQPAGEAESEMAAVEQRVAEAEAAAEEAQAKADAAEERAVAAETRAMEAEERAATAETRVSDLRDTVNELNTQLAEANTPPPVSAPPAPPEPNDPYLITSGVIEDGYHVGYLVSSGLDTFSFDMAEILADGSWKNVNPKIRTLPVNPVVNYVYGAPAGVPIELYVENQRVLWVYWI